MIIGRRRPSISTNRQESFEQLSVPYDFREWQIMMEIEFGKRYNQLFRGPCWSGCNQADKKNPLKARVNVASLCHSTITEDLNKRYDATTTTEIQVKILDKLEQIQPDGRFWLKLDGTDIKAALQETKPDPNKLGEWNGDVDKRDEELKKLKEEYVARNETCKLLTASPNSELCDVLVSELEKDRALLRKLMQEASKEYSNSINKASNKKRKEMNWHILELTNLLERVEKLLSTYITASSKQPAAIKTIHQGHISDLKNYLRDLFKKKRKAASHILIVMVSDEQRRKKPYSVPIQYIPYHNLTADDIYRIVAEAKRAMVNRNLKCVGVVTDGEFNTLRTQGQTRPLHLYQVIQNARKSVANLKKPQLLEMLVKTSETADGSPVVTRPDAVPDSIINQFDQLLQDGVLLSDALTVIREGMVPTGYKPQPWRLDAPETLTEKLKSIVATYRFRRELFRFQLQGVDFTKWLYVPEIDPITGLIIHAREDHNHLVKRIASHTRDGQFPVIDTRRFKEAHESDLTDLTETALKGVRKQSVPDAEKLLSFAVADFMDRNGYTAEAEYVGTIAAWHEASDGRGINQEQRSKANQAMKTYIMKQWMPWYDPDAPDYTSIDINVRADKLCGFSRQTIIGVTTNIDSQELRRSENEAIGHSENPRAGTTDDVELFFSLLHTKTGGKHVTLKDFKYWWQKLVLEFGYKMVDDLPFYFHTLNERFTLDDMPSFDEPGEGDSRLRTLHRRFREDSSVITAGRSSLPAHNSTSIRQRNHRPEVEVAAPTTEMEEQVQFEVNKQLTNFI
ncbi:uncharacterized protein [Amphiura filiformis]|uniref:uncharacterized protein n=1 Tax=Amphiura filiformis TaxID=82378 RepID=UPI003B218556